MKKIMTILVSAGLAFMFSMSFAVTTTSVDANWTCTTNASSSADAAEKAADDQMANTTKSCADAFAFAEKNCRDCTKITCEVKE
jgi:hypothetical protein